jgi:hypothetical protein
MRCLTVCAFFCHCHNVAAGVDYADVAVAVLCHRSHMLIPLPTLVQWRAAWDHVRVNTPLLQRVFQYLTS